VFWSFVMARLLVRGVTGLDVKELQAALNFHLRKPFTPLEPDGIFGPLTDARVREFQTRAGLTPPDGKVGPNTIAALYRTLTGVIEAVLKPRKAPPQAFGPSRGRGFGPVFAQVGPVTPDFVPPSQAVPQARATASQGFEMESKLVFDPLAKPSKGEQPLKLTMTILIPWPVFLPKPLKLEIEPSTSASGTTQLDGKLKVPYTFTPTRRLELTPYFFVGGGVQANNYVDLNVGGGAAVKLKLIDNIARTGVELSLSADGGVKFKYDREENKSALNGFLEGGVILERKF
jgi:hypothetical protein